MDTRAKRDVPTDADPLTRHLLRQMAARATRPELPELPDDEAEVDHGPDAIHTMRLIAAWHRRGIEAGFPELMARPRFATGGRRLRAPTTARAA
jgi:aryl carrier-like protein